MKPWPEASETFKLPVIEFGRSTMCGMMVMATTTPNAQRRRRTISVIFHNDDPYDAMDYIVAALLKSTPSLSAEEAVNIMLEAHNTGQAVVITCSLWLLQCQRS
jgi:ATP-dependent Clp protease adapter protein ClpS